MKKNRFDTALVTGASSGIGRSLAIELSRNSTFIYLTGRNQKELTNTAKLLDCESSISVADLSTKNGVEKISKIIEEENLDLLINNAGFGSGGYFHERTLEKEISLIDTNVDAVVKLTHTYINKLINTDKKGSILNVGSVVSFFPRPSNVTYAASKAFVRSFSNALHAKYKDKGIFVSCLYPGLTYTNFFGDPESMRKYKFVGQEPEHVAKIAIKGLFKNKRRIVPGFINYLIIFIGKYLYKYY